MNILNEIKERPKISMEVMVRLADTLFSYRSIKKTHLYFHSRTNWNSFDRHMTLLVKNGYVKYAVIEKDEEYTITESGRALLELLLQFNEKIHKSS